MRRNPLLMTVMGNPSQNPCHGYRSNPFILIDSQTNKIIRSWKGAMTSPTPWEWAKDAARRLGRSVFVVAHPYVPPGFSAGVEVSPMFYFGGPYEEVHPDGRMTEGPPGGYKRNSFGPAIAGGIAGALTTRALSNPKSAPRCPQCGSKNTGCETAGEWYCYDCGNQWNKTRSNPSVGRGFMCQHGYGARGRCPSCQRMRRAGVPRATPCRHGYYDWSLCRWCPPPKGARAAARKKGYAVNPSRTRKQTIPIEKFAAMVKAQRDPALWKDFVAKCRAYHKWSHGTWPRKVTIERVKKPGMKGLWITFDMGREPEKTYIMPKGTKRKGAWKHPWESMPQLRGDAEAGLILTKLNKKNRLTDFLHG